MVGGWRAQRNERHNSHGDESSNAERTCLVNKAPSAAARSGSVRRSVAKRASVATNSATGVTGSLESRWKGVPCSASDGEQRYSGQ